MEGLWPRARSPLMLLLSSCKAFDRESTESGGVGRAYSFDVFCIVIIDISRYKEKI